MAEQTADALSRAVLDALRDRSEMLVTVESCTGGLIAAGLTATAGSSDVVYGGFVTYDNHAKMAMVGVPEPLLIDHGAVSEPVARAMAEGARARAGVAHAVSVTGIAGPGGGSAAKPVGLVWFAHAWAMGTTTKVMRFGDIGRAGVREASVETALRLVLDDLQLP